MIKHPTCARVLRIILIALFISAIMVLAPSFAIHSYAQVIPLPIDESGGVPPHKWGFQGDSWLGS